MRRILIYGDVDLNVIDGSSVWLANLAKLLSMEEDVMVDVLLKKRIRRDVLVRQLQKEYRVRLLYAKDYVDSITEVDAHNVARMIRRVDALAEYSCIIVRGMAVTRKLLKEPFVDRLVPYLTDFCHDEHKIEAQEKDFLSRLYERVQLFLVQTDAMKNYLMRLLQVPHPVSDRFSVPQAGTPAKIADLRRQDRQRLEDQRTVGYDGTAVCNRSFDHAALCRRQVQPGYGRAA